MILTVHNTMQMGVNMQKLITVALDAMGVYARRNY